MKIEMSMDNGNFRLGITAGNLQDAQMVVDQIIKPMYSQMGYDIEVKVTPKDAKPSRFIKL